MGATLEQLARGIVGRVERGDAKKLAKLHGHPWKALLKRMKALARTSPPAPGPSLLDRAIEEASRG